MGCFYCNLQSISADMNIHDRVMPRMTKKLEKELNDPEFQKNFMHELAYDIAARHPDVARWVRIYQKKLAKRRRNELRKGYGFKLKDVKKLHQQIKWG